MQKRGKVTVRSPSDQAKQTWAFWEKLPNDVREGLLKAMAEATAYGNEISQKDNDNALAAMKASGKTEFYEPSKAERDALCKAMHPVYEKMSDRVGEDLVAAIQKEVAPAQ